MESKNVNQKIPEKSILVYLRDHGGQCPKMSILSDHLQYKASDLTAAIACLVRLKLIVDQQDTLLINKNRNS